MHCVSQCPVNKYNASQSIPRVCLPCHLNCVGGCSGPDNTIGPNGCRSCHKAVLNADASVVCICNYIIYFFISLESLNFIDHLLLLLFKPLLIADFLHLY